MTCWIQLCLVILFSSLLSESTSVRESDFDRKNSLDIGNHCKRNGKDNVHNRFFASIKKQDEERKAYLMEPFDFDFMNPESKIQLKNRFYRIVASPLQGYCNVSKLMGGKWLPSCGSMDGSKYVCLDKTLPAVNDGKCIVYSFGIGDDWSFEDSMADLGCRVYAFDPTIDSPTKRSENVFFEKIGLSHISGTSEVTDNTKNNMKISVTTKTLKQILKLSKDLDSIITYIKVDIEGSELQAFSGWVKSGVLKNVAQFGIEFHLGLATVGSDKRVISILYELLRSIKRMHEQGFRIVHYGPNTCVAKSQDQLKMYYAYFDVVFVNTNL